VFPIDPDQLGTRPAFQRWQDAQARLDHGDVVRLDAVSGVLLPRLYRFLCKVGRLSWRPFSVSSAQAASLGPFASQKQYGGRSLLICRVG
jgi:hypothetical protein